MIHPVYRCARCGKDVMRRPITDTSGNVYGVTCAKAVGISKPAKEPRERTARYRVARSDQPELFEVGAV